MIQCSLNQTLNNSTGAKEAVQQCTSADLFTDIENCIEVIDSMSPEIARMQNRLSLLLNGQAASAVEVAVRDDLQSALSKKDLLGELCTNYLQVDGETLGCKVDRPAVAVFYESGSSQVQQAFEHFEALAAYAPFEDLADFEFVPYGTTRFDETSGNYSCSSEAVCKANWIHVSF